MSMKWTVMRVVLVCGVISFLMLSSIGISALSSAAYPVAMRDGGPDNLATLIMPAVTFVLPKTTLVLPKVTLIIPKTTLIFPKATLILPVTVVTKPPTTAAPTTPAPSQTAKVVTATPQPSATRPLVTQANQPTRVPATAVTAQCPSEAVVFDQPVGNSNHIFVYFASGQLVDRTPNLSGKAAHPTVSPDNETILFEYREGTGNADLWYVPLCGGTPTQLTNTKDMSEESPYWGPTNDVVLVANGQLAFLNTQTGVVDVVGIDSVLEPELNSVGQAVFSRNGGLTVATKDGTVFSLKVAGQKPHWTQDGKGILFNAPLQPGSPEQLLGCDANQQTADPNARDMVQNPAKAEQAAIINAQGQLAITSSAGNTVVQNTKDAAHPQWTAPKLRGPVDTQTCTTFLQQFKIQ